MLPFNFHWYIGATPPFVGVAVNVTLSPEHILVVGVDMTTEGTATAVTLIVIADDVTFVTVLQLALDANLHAI